MSLHPVTLRAAARFTEEGGSGGGLANAFRLEGEGHYIGQSRLGGARYWPVLLTETVNWGEPG